jgi:hypothetical protein
MELVRLLDEEGIDVRKKTLVVLALASLNLGGCVAVGLTALGV